ncbi:MAG: cytochrome c oxidase subunit, partial [Candidatus Eremiobacteraeota bacterium]|nr:cytochrome c oxidase subunit [Candidatus Eremiobacteraeota bacterium]
MATVAPGVPTGPYHAVLDHIHPEPTSFIRKYIFSIDAKVIGIQYMITGAIFFAISGFMAELIRTQLLSPNGLIVSSAT